MQAAELGITILMGIALAASAGLRAFLPPLALSLLAWTGYVTLAPAYEWLARWEVAAAFAIATLLEVLGDKYPGLDHMLDAAGLVVRPLAGALVVSSLVTGMDPWLSLCLGIIVGGGVSATVTLAKSKLRLLSSGVTAGIGNPLLSLVEDCAALCGTVLGMLAPVLAGLLVLLGLAWITRMLVRHGRQRLTSY